MRVQVTHPIRTADDRLLPGAVVDVPEEQALEWIANEWAYALPEHYGAQFKPEPRHDDRIYKRTVKNGKNPQ